MEIREYIQAQMAGSYRLSDAAIQGTTEEQFNWAPPGAANPIKATLLHTIAGEDLFIQGVFQGQKRLWETQEWGARIGISMPPGRGGGWDEARSKTLALEPMLEYQKAVRAATDAYLARVTPEELDRKVLFAGEQRAVAEVLVILAVHIAGHAGEISGLKGVQGDMGLPY